MPSVMILNVIVPLDLVRIECAHVVKREERGRACRRLWLDIDCTGSRYFFSAILRGRKVGEPSWTCSGSKADSGDVSILRNEKRVDHSKRKNI